MISVKKQSIDGLENWQTNLNSLTTHTKLERLSNGNIRQTVTNLDGMKVVTNSNSGKVTTIQVIKVPQWNKLTPLDGESKKYYQSKFFPERVVQPNEHPVEEIE